MIKIKRPCPPKNTKMEQKKAQVLKAIKQSINEDKKTKIENLWTENKVKAFLYQYQHGKCCYCERKRDKREMDVEHFRPKAEVKKNKNHQGYWWLAYEWDNLLLSCKTCNTKKGTQFPLQNEQSRAFTPKDDLKKEKPFLINPLTENPEDFIEYDCLESTIMIKAIGKNERGKRTVNELTGINNLEVLKNRAEHLEGCQNLFTLYKNNLEKREEKKQEIKEKISSSSEFAGLARFYFKNKDF